MTELTPELIAQGWKPHDKSFQLPLKDGDIYQAMWGSGTDIRIGKPMVCDCLNNRFFTDAVAFRTLSPDTLALSAEPVAWQYQLENGRWSNMPGDWTPDEDALGRYTYRPLFTSPPDQSARIEELERNVRDLQDLAKIRNEQHEAVIADLRARLAKSVEVMKPVQIQANRYMHMEDHECVGAPLLNLRAIAQFVKESSEAGQ